MTVPLIFCISFSLTLFISGIRIGLRIRSHKMEKKKEELMNLLKEVKDSNNTFLSHISKVYHEAEGKDGQWTEMDDYLLNMWME